MTRSSRATPALFHAEPFAPWCERARWALDHHGIVYREIAHVPLVAEVRLRLALRRWRRRVTVPLLVRGAVVLMDSDEIARYAEQVGAGQPLFPSSCASEIEQWMATSEAILTSGRALLLPRLAGNAAALREQLPPLIHARLRPALQWLASAGIRHLTGKYATRDHDQAWHEHVSREALLELRRCVRRGAPFLVSNTLTYADVTMAAALQFVVPVGAQYISLAPATRDAWTNRALADEFGDVLAWRDALYAAHRLQR